MSTNKLQNNELTSSFTQTGEINNTKLPPVNDVKAELGHKRYVCDEGTSELYVEKKSISMMDGSTGVFVSEGGICLDGKISIIRPPSELRIGTFWVFNDKILTCLPSTNYTPIPTLKYKEPQNVLFIQRFLSNLTSMI